MGRYTGPACRLCRQAGEKLFLKGTRCQTPKCAIERRRRAPGDRRMRRRRPSDYALRLIEKQKLRYSYGLLEGQFVRYLKRAKKRIGCHWAATFTAARTALRQHCLPVEFRGVARASSAIGDAWALPRKWSQS